jgi:hypothetical protein
MRTSTSLCSVPRTRHAVTIWVALGLAIHFCVAPRLGAQSGVSPNGGSSKGGSSTPAASDGFSIESEMLTYRALEANSEAIACDIEGVIAGGKPDFDRPAQGAACAALPSQPSRTIVLLPFEKAELDDFAAWRAAMADMSWLQDKAKALGCPGDLSAKAEENPAVKTAAQANPGSQSKGASSTSSMGALVGLTPAGPAIGLAQSALGLFASQEEAHSVGGTIQNLAFLNNVARQLKVLNMLVLTPSSFASEAVTAVDRTASPFLASRERTQLAGACLADVGSTDPRNKRAQETASEIETYVALLSAQKPAKSSGGGAGKGAGNGAANGASVSGNAKGNENGSGAGNATGDQTGNETQNGVGGNTGSGAVASPMAAILRADGLAQKLGFRFDGKTGELKQPGSGSHYILMIQALESGGTVTGKTSILGTFLRYSGGAAGTYALFSADGDLACSGNVYNYLGSFKSKHFTDKLNSVHFDPKQQVLFQSTCPALSNSPQTPAVPTTIR